MANNSKNSNKSTWKHQELKFFWFKSKELREAAWMTLDTRYWKSLSKRLLPGARLAHLPSCQNMFEIQRYFYLGSMPAQFFFEFFCLMRAILFDLEKLMQRKPKEQKEMLYISWFWRGWLFRTVISLMFFSKDSLWHVTRHMLRVCSRFVILRSFLFLHTKTERKKRKTDLLAFRKREVNRNCFFLQQAAWTADEEKSI